MSFAQVVLWLETGTSMLVCQTCDSFIGYGFLQSYSDYSLFTDTKESVQINVLVYVDDLVIFDNDSAAVTCFKAYLS